MNERDRAEMRVAVEREVANEMRDVRSELRTDLEAHLLGAARLNAIGVCGFCNGTIVAKVVSSSWGGQYAAARCGMCGAEPVPQTMLNRRSETRPAPENRRKP